MKYLALFPALLLSVQAFSTIPVGVRQRSVGAPSFYPSDFEKAVECSENYGLCDVEELLKLADELDAAQGCFFESTQEDCDAETTGRHNVADLLRLQSVLQMRQSYLMKDNQFAEDVKKEREDYMFYAW